ncbi:hypothetical protein OHB41_34125 [Streptomyces sp. NBC_01571]|uniref:hypothetical protein n=1 Tax=Streptomyces sp. NBC_01571 TaxID=2975883 RepID=UPI002250091A|nr:hypothetical protein [Streptomyces sp. NBC_01571]MCX4578141.1 hypothetical protein [Streptomyces sp. NBC_01571]
MSSDHEAIEAHENGTRYGGKVLSLIPAPDGWSVGTQVERINRKTNEIERDEAKVFPLIAWALIDAMFHGGDKKVQVEPMFLTRAGATHANEFRWQNDAGGLDGDWRTGVSVDVIPAPHVLAIPPTYGEPVATSKTEDHTGHRHESGI